MIMENIIIKFDMQTCHVELNCPYFLQHMTLAKLKKIFELMCRESWRNESAIENTDKYIQLCIAEAHSDWHKASVDFQNKYVDVRFKYELTEPQKKAIERENKKLHNTVKRMKAAYNRMIKIQEQFNAVKQRFSV